MARKRRSVQEQKDLDKRKKIIYEVVLELVEKMYGPNARKILHHIMTTKDIVAEETLGKELNIKSNEARRILQKLADEAILRYKKAKKGGRTVHAWFLNDDQLEGILISRLKKTREKLLSRLRYEEEQTLYICPVCRRKYTLDSAFDYNFLCPVDGAPLEEYDPTPVVEFLKKTIEEIDKELEKLGVT